MWFESVLSSMLGRIHEYTCVCTHTAMYIHICEYVHIHACMNSVSSHYLWHRATEPTLLVRKAMGGWGNSSAFT